MFGSTMICWRSLLDTVKQAEERATYGMMTHSPRDREIFDRRRHRLARSGWRAFGPSSRPSARTA